MWDSLLSEYAAMGFEYGYAVASPAALVHVGGPVRGLRQRRPNDHRRVHRSSEQKWGQHSGVVLLLPHGYEGQGPDHSSARPERFLQMAAQDNMTVVMPSTPASYFHFLRWQALAEHHKPAIAFTPKSMLRLKAAASNIDEFTHGRFRPVIDDTSVNSEDVKLVLFCSGKITWELFAERERLGRKDVAIVRIERLYPLAVDDVMEVLDHLPADARARWVQEEPENQGAWTYMLLNLVPHLDRVLGCASRPASASPATGLHSVFEREQKALLKRAFAN